MKPIFSLLMLMSIASSALSQGYPSKPISLVIPFGAGGDSDLSGRLLAQYAAKYLGNASFVPLNRVGASGSIGTMLVRVFDLVVLGVFRGVASLIRRLLVTP